MENARREGGRDWRAVGAGLRAVVFLFLTALDDLLAAAAGSRPLRDDARDVADAIGETYRKGRERAVDAEVVEQPGDPLDADTWGGPRR